MEKSSTTARPSVRPKRATWWQRSFPHPTLSLFLWLFWLLMNNTIAPGHLALGAVLAWFIPWLTYPFWPESTSLKKPWVAFRFIRHVLWDVLEANASLMFRILGPVEKLKPAFVTYELEIKNDFTITILASTISLAPGTFTADLSDDRRAMLIHILNAADTERIITAIKTRYELPLKEIFE